MTSVLLPIRTTDGDRSLRELPPKRVSDEELVADLRQDLPRAGASLFTRYGDYVERLLWGLLGPTPDIEDLLHEVFMRALVAIESLEDPSRLRSWLAGIAVHTTREWLRKRKRSWWLKFVDEVPELAHSPVSAEVGEAARCTFEVLAKMREDERIVFSLRFIEGMDMAEIAVACDVSLSTAKRRLKEAEGHFLSRARRVPALAPWIEEGGRWAP